MPPPLPTLPPSPCRSQPLAKALGSPRAWTTISLCLGLAGPLCEWVQGGGWAAEDGEVGERESE